MRHISKHKQLVGLGLDLYAVGRQVEAARAQVAALVRQGHSWDSREVRAACGVFQASSNQFAALERQYQALAWDLRDRHEQP